MDQQTCPYLGTLDSKQNQKPGVSYPSFENHCFADHNLADRSFVDGTLLLGDQATYCLFGGCNHCPRFQDAQRYARSSSSHFPSSSNFSSGFSPLPTLTYPKEPGPETIDFGILDFEQIDPDLLAVDVARADRAFELTDYAVGSTDSRAAANFGAAQMDPAGMNAPSMDEYWDDDDNHPDDERRFSPIWLVATMFFLGTFLCGGVMAAFLSFQVVRSNLFASPPVAGAINIVDPVAGSADLEQLLVAQEDAANPAVYVVWTATPDGLVSVDEQPLVEDAVAALPSEPDRVSIVDVGSGEAINETIDAPSVDGESAAEAAAESESSDSADETSKLAIVAPTATISFPKAVTPTPIVVLLDNLDGPQDDQGALEVDVANVSAPDEDNSAAPRFIPAPTSTPVPEINVQIAVPTPPDSAPAPEQPADALIDTVNEIAAQPVAADTSTSNEIVVIPEEEEDEKEEEATPEPTPTATATWPPPLVLFNARDPALMAGECTEIAWTVENVRAVYVENIAMNGSGDREVCIKDKNKTYVMTVVMPDGGTKIYTTTVQLLLPTQTPTATPTFTPVPIPTETWTPVPPPATPTPSFIYGVALSAAGNSLSCTAGSSCEIGLTVKNIGNTTDNFTVFVERGGEWLPNFCRSDGVCAVDRFVVAGVGADNVASLTLRFDIPDGAAPRNESYIFRASSDSSAGAARSESITIEVKVN